MASDVWDGQFQTEDRGNVNEKQNLDDNKIGTHVILGKFQISGLNERNL
jgi:hypothetical protein